MWISTLNHVRAPKARHKHMARINNPFAAFSSQHWSRSIHEQTTGNKKRRRRKPTAWRQDCSLVPWLHDVIARKRKYYINNWPLSGNEDVICFYPTAIAYHGSWLQLYLYERERCNVMLVQYYINIKQNGRVSRIKTAKGFFIFFITK